jgi:hypothetical protein
LDGHADRAGESPADDLADFDRLLVEAGKLRCALECEPLVGDLVAVDVVRAAWVAEPIPGQVLRELLHSANVSHAHVEIVKILTSDATGYSTEPERRLFLLLGRSAEPFNASKILPSEKESMAVADRSAPGTGAATRSKLGDTCPLALGVSMAGSFNPPGSEVADPRHQSTNDVGLAGAARADRRGQRPVAAPGDD